MSEVVKPAAASDPNAEIDNAKVEGVRRARPDKDENCVENSWVETTQKYVENRTEGNRCGNGTSESCSDR